MYKKAKLLTEMFVGHSPRETPSCEPNSQMEMMTFVPETSMFVKKGQSAVPSRSATSSPVKCSLASKHKLTRGASVAVPDRKHILHLHYYWTKEGGGGWGRLYIKKYLH